MFEGAGMTDFRNVKLKVLSQEHSAAFQEAVFESGGRWRFGGDKVRYTDAKYLFTSNDDEPVVTCSDSDVEFSAAKKRLVSFVTPAYQMTKIRIRNPEHSEFVQKKLFENGCSWIGGIIETKHAHERFLTIGGMGEIRFCSEEFFNEQKHLTEIFIEDDSMDELDEHEKASSNAGPKTTTIGKLVVDVEADITTRFLGTETSDGSTASYYELPDGATELQHLISHKNMNAQIGEIFRSCYRYGQASHSNKLRDAKKIQFYINAEIERLEKLNAK